MAERVRRSVNGRTQGVKIGDAMLVLDDDLAIEESSSTVQPAACINDSAICRRPVIAVSGEGSDPPLIDDNQGAVAVILNLMNPSVPGWWFRQESRDFQPDKAESR
jgi:hypothetical protein